MSDKYRAACVEYAAASAEVKRLTKDIHEAASSCVEAQIQDWLIDNPGREYWEAPQDFSPHLAKAYDRTYDPEGDGCYYENHDGNVDRYLAETCILCLRAHHAIESRKKARKRFGVAKRRISALGRSVA